MARHGFLVELDIEALFEEIDLAEIIEIDNKLVNPPPLKRRRKHRQGYSTKLLNRKKAELNQLRNEEEDLRAWLDHLKSVVKETDVSSEQGKSSQEQNSRQREWIAKALDEFQRRQRAEAINRKLKVIQAAQANVHESLLEIIRVRSSPEDESFVFSDPVTPRRSFNICETHESTLIIGTLREETNSLFQRVKELDFQHESDQFSSSLVATLDPKCGKMYESSTISFVPGCMKDVSDALWIEYSTPRKFPYKSYRYMNLEDTNSVKKSFDLILHAQRGCMSINGLMFARKYEDPKRIVMVRAYVMILPTAGLQIRCKHWTIVTPWKEGCFVQFFVQLYTESQEGFTALPEDVEYVQEVALSTWSMKMHFYSKRLLDMLGDMADTGR